jgi:hypothetical protein
MSTLNGVENMPVVEPTGVELRVGYTHRTSHLHVRIGGRRPDTLNGLVHCVLPGVERDFVDIVLLEEGFEVMGSGRTQFRLAGEEWRDFGSEHLILEDDVSHQVAVQKPFGAWAVYGLCRKTEGEVSGLYIERTY